MKRRCMAIILCIALVLSSLSIAYAVESGTISFGTDYTGTISETAGEKTYGITLDQSGQVNVTVMADMDALDLEIRGADGASLWKASPKRNASLGVISHSEGVNLTKGNYTLHVKQSGSAAGSYKLNVGFTSAGESFSEPAGGINNSRETASPISVGKAYKGQFALNDKVDWYVFTLEGSGQLDLTVERECYQIFYGIYSADNPSEKLWYNRNYMDGGLWGVGSASHTIHLTAGTYYFGVETNGERGGGNYNFETSFSLTKETCKEDNAGNNNNTILVADAMKLGETYVGQLASNEKSDFYQFNVPKKMTLWFNVTAERDMGFRILDVNGIEVYGKWTTAHEEKVDLAAGQYYFNVYRNYTANTGDYQFKLAEYKLDQPKLSSVANVSSGVKVKWKAVNLATGYHIYRKAGSGSWKQIGSADGVSVLSYTDKTAKSGTTYKYSVAAYNQDLTSTYNKTGKKIKRLSQPVVKIENQNSAVKVSWKKITGAAGYEVYKKAPGAKKWTKVKTIKAKNVISYTDKKVANGKTYTYTVKAYAGDYESSQTSGTKVVRLTTPKIKSVSMISGQKADVKWAKNAKASGYEVQYAKKKNFSGQNTMNAKGTSTTKQTLYLLEKGKNYYVKMRTYKTINGVTYYSNWSTVKKTKKVK